MRATGFPANAQDFLFIRFASRPKNGRVQPHSNSSRTTNGHQDRTTDYADDTDSKNAKNQITKTKEWPAFARLRRGKRSQERCSVRCPQRICAMKATSSPFVRWGQRTLQRCHVWSAQRGDSTIRVHSWL